MANLLSTILSGNNHITFGPNSTWSSYLRVGGNGHSVSSNEYASVVTTNGNLHLDAGTSRATYINYYAGTAGVAFGNGASSVVAWMGPDGDLWKGGSDNSGTQYVYNSGTWGISITGNADTVDGKHATNNANNLAVYESNGYLYIPSWMNVNGGGIFSGTNNAHLRPNTGAYGAWEMIGSKNGWSGIYFNDSGDYLMANNNEVGHYQNGVGWKFRWYQGEMYISSGTTGGGTERTVIHSGNIGSQSVNYANSAGSVAWGNVSSKPSYIMYYQGFTLDANTMDTNSTGFTYANNAPFYGPIARFSTGGGYDLWLGGSYNNSTGAFYLRTRNGDNATLNPWREIIHSGNIASQSVSYADESGYSASTGTTDNIGGVQFRNTGSNAGTNADTIDSNGITYYTAGVANFSGNATDGALYSQRYSTSWQHQIAGDYRSGQIALRGRNNGTWQSWRTVLDSGNYSSYVVPKTGGSFTGGIGGTTFDFGDGGYIGGATTISSNLTVNQVYNNGWFRNYGTQGMYNESYGTHFYSSGGATWNITGSGGVVELTFRSNHQSTIRGFVYADTSNNIGFLNNAGNWSLLTNSSRNTTLYGQLTVGEGIGYSSIFMTDSDEGTRELHCNSNRIGFLTQAGSWGAWLYDSADWEAGSSVRAPIFYDSNDTTFFLDPNADLSLRVYGEICNSNYAEGKMQPGALNIGRIDTNYAWDGGSWASDVRLGLLANTSETWEFGIHDSGDSVMSVVHFDGGSTLTMGRNLGWGQCVVNAPAGYVSNGNPWGTANSAYFPNGISTAGGTNWIYGFTYIGNAPSNGSGHEFTTSGTQYSTGSITTPLFLVNNHSDNTKGYRIHNTSGSSVSAMFVNSSNQLVIAAGAVDQVNLNKKVFVNGVALGVNVAPSATAGRIDASNDIVAYSSSDERLKYNIAPIENALDKVKSLTGVEFDWKPEYKHAHGYEGHDTGIIAQQVEAVMPSAVRTNDTGFFAVRYEKLIGLLIEGMKEQQAQIDELKAKLDGLTK